MADPTPAAARGTSGGPGLLGTLKSKWGPFPVWGWLALLTAVAVGYWLYEQRKGKSSSTKTATPSDVGQPGVVVINQGGPGRRGGGKPPPTTENGGGPYRHVVSQAGLSLDQLAKDRHTTPDEIIDVTEGGPLSKQNLAAFEKYVKGGTSRPMPKGLIYYTSVGPAEG